MKAKPKAIKGALSVVEGSRGRAGHDGELSLYDRVHAAISDRRLPPGTKLTEESLREIFGLSRARVRKVLQRLAHDKVVTFEPNRGAFVARPSAEEARHVFAARRVIEDAIIRAGAGAIGPADIEDLRRLNQAEHMAHEGGDLRESIRLSGEFHLRLAGHGGNPIFTEMLQELVSRSSLILAVYETPGGPDCAFDEHQEITDALAAGDADAAAESMGRHLRKIEDRLNLIELDISPISLESVFAERA